jgi:hypothetical protein
VATLTSPSLKAAQRKRHKSRLDIRFGFLSSSGSLDELNSVLYTPKEVRKRSKVCEKIKFEALKGVFYDLDVVINEVPLIFVLLTSHITNFYNFTSSTMRYFTGIQQRHAGADD